MIKLVLMLIIFPLSLFAHSDEVSDIIKACGYQSVSLPQMETRETAPPSRRFKTCRWQKKQYEGGFFEIHFIEDDPLADYIIWIEEDPADSNFVSRSAPAAPKVQ